MQRVGVLFGFNCKISPTTVKKGKLWKPRHMVATVNYVRKNFTGLKKAASHLMFYNGSHLSTLMFINFNCKRLS
jgi:hypothetical protein